MCRHGSFLAAGVMEGLRCVVADVRLPGIDGMELQGGFEANGRSCQSSSSLLVMTMTSANGRCAMARSLSW